MTIDEARAQLAWTLDLIPSGASNRPGTRLKPTSVTVHNTANAGSGADALAHARYLKGPDARARKVSWHYTVDDYRVVQHLPDSEIGWHAGSGNRHSLGIEICEHPEIDQEAANHRAALLVAVLMHTHRLRPQALVPHQSWTGKHCPRLLLTGAGGFDSFVAAADNYRVELSENVTETVGLESVVVDGEEPNSSVLQAHDCASRVRVLERLLGRALADAELLREELDALRSDSYEMP